MPAGIGIFVLSAPIFGALFGGGETGARILSILGIASFFACAQLMTTAVLQANGFERVPMITYPIGGLAQIVLDWVLVGNPNIGIVGSPLGTLACYLTITVLNLAIIKRRVPDPPRLLRVFLRPAAIAAVMGVCAWAVYGLIEKLVIPSLGEGRLMLAAYLGVTIVIAAIIYAVLIIVTRTVTRDDLKLIPKGEKIANFLKIK
jgi:stage V sporulation protein B